LEQAEKVCIKDLMMFERKIMSKIYGCTRIADGQWKIKTSQEINDILKGQNNWTH
jgi:hypothetical protein